jgi:hypothetical protein
MIGMFVRDTFDRITAYFDQLERWRAAKARDNALRSRRPADRARRSPALD